VDLLPDPRIEKSPDTVLFGLHAGIDSFGLLSLLTAAEEQIEKIAGTEVSLMNPKIMSTKPSPFRTLGTLAQYIDEQLA